MSETGTALTDTERTLNQEMAFDAHYAIAEIAKLADNQTERTSGVEHQVWMSIANLCARAQDDAWEMMHPEDRKDDAVESTI